MPPPSPDRDLTLVTGASTGIGQELARVFAARGHDLVLVARRADRLEALAAELRRRHDRQVLVLPRDLLAEGAAAELLEATSQAGAVPGVLVNNAGVMELGGFQQLPPEALERMVELNTRVLTALSRRFLPAMVARGRGRILNVASTAAFQPVPSMAVYAATKAFVLSLTEALSEELRGTGVTVTALCPGLTATDMVEKARDANPRARLVPGFLVAEPEDVARDGYEACMAGRVISVPGAANRVLTDWSRLQPRWVVRTLGGLVGRRFLEPR